MATRIRIKPGKSGIKCYILPDCICCLEPVEIKENAQLECKSKCSINICKTCLLNIRDPRCPICRRVNFTSPHMTNKLKNTIKSRKEQDDKETIEDATRVQIEQIREENAHLSGNIFLTAQDVQDFFVQLDLFVLPYVHARSLMH